MPQASFVSAAASRGSPLTSLVCLPREASLSLAGLRRSAADETFNFFICAGNGERAGGFVRTPL